MGRMSQESCTGQHVFSCVEYLHSIGCARDVFIRFLTMSELVEWVELFCTFGNETMMIVDETKVVGEIGYIFLVVESQAQPEPSQEVIESQPLRCDGQGRRVPCSRIHTCQVE